VKIYKIWDMTRYQKGRSLEYYVKRRLESEDYLVMRTAGSHSPFDLICVNMDGSGEVLFVQVSKRFERKKYEALKDLALSLKINILYVFKKKGKLEFMILCKENG